MRVDELSVESDPEPEFDDDGYTSLLNPEEEEDAFEGLVDSGLSDEEAQEAVDYMKPLSEEEEAILDETPGLDGLTRVDDSEHEQWLGKKFNEGTKAMDRVLEDASYGEGKMNDEEQMERRDTDDESGFSLKRAFRKAGRGLRRAGRGVGRGIKSPLTLAKKFVPNRDKAKAALVRNLYRRLWFEHANWLAQQDKASNVPLKTRAQYEAVAKLWAKAEIAKKKLPMKYAVGSSEILGADIMGADVVGTWWNPFSWFQARAQAALNETQAERMDQPPADQYSEVQQPGDMNTDFQDPYAQQAQPYPEEAYDEAGWNGVRQAKAPHDPVADSLGAFAAHVMGKDLPARDNPSVDAIVRDIVAKLRSSQSISPGEVGLLSSAAREGNERARRVIGVLKTKGAVVSGDESGLDPWMYKLNPTYWFASSRKKSFVDKERKAWKDNARLREDLAKKKTDLDAAERATQAALAVEQAKAESADTEAKLKEIATSLKGNVAGSFVGHEKVTPISDVVRKALEKTGKAASAEKLLAKVKDGEELDEQELREARQIARVVGKVRVVHGDLVNGADASMHGAFVGACALGGISAALEQNDRHKKVVSLITSKTAPGQPLQQAERDSLARVLSGQRKIKKFTAALVSGKVLRGCPESWTRGAFVGAAKAMGPEDKKMLEAVVKLAKVGNPRAVKALAILRKTGEISGGDDVGLSLKSAFKYATAPVWLPAYGAYKGAKWTGQKLGIVSKGGKASPEQVRLKKLQAAQKRAKAAQARARAADAQNEAEYRAQQAIASAADAEADAADAEAVAKEQAMRTAEVEAAPDLASTEADGSEGEFVGSWDAFLGKDTKGAKAVAKAREASPAGQKVRGAAVVFKRAKAGDPKARKAVEVMVKKAKAGDQQALRDVNAMQVARRAYEARAAARKQQVAAHREKTRQLASVARGKKFEALRKRFEARTAERLARMERKRELQKLAKVERRASAGNPKAKAYVAKRVACARKGDKRAQAQVQAMRLGRAVRLSVRTRDERRNMRAAQYLAKRIRANDPAAIRQFEVIKAAAAQGNPNAKRGLARLALAGALAATVATGVVVLPKVAGKKDKKKPVPGTPAYAQAKRKVEGAKEKARAGTATREELVASARTAQEIGDRQSAGVLLAASASAPSATEGVKKAAGQVKAAQAGNPEAKAQLDKDLAAAREGDTTAVNRMGQVAAARTVAAVEAGQPVPPAMRDAVNLQERARAGDPAAQATLQRVSEAATAPNPAPEATAAAVYATGAAALASSLASKPKARQEFMAKVNEPVPPSEQSAAQAKLAAIVKRTDEGTVTPAEGRQGVELAMRLGKPRVAAEISAKAPPLEVDAMSSLPDDPLPPIAGVWNLFKETLKALTLTTRDPLANYREGVAARSKEPAATSSGVGWSPFDLFKSKKGLSLLAMLSAPVSATAAVANLAKGHKGSAPAAKVTFDATKSPAVTPKATPASSAGADDTRSLFKKALADKKMSRADFNRAVDLHCGPGASPDKKKEFGSRMLDFLAARKVKVG
jgi:hypothetical protein